MAQQIVVIDDEEDIRKVLRIHLSKAGYEVLEAEDGEKAIEIFKTHAPGGHIEAAICDLRMPIKGGEEVFKWIKQDYPSLPVILLTGFPDVKMAVDYMKKGAFEYLVKPVESEKLLEVVARAVQAEKQRWGF